MGRSRRARRRLERQRARHPVARTQRSPIARVALAAMGALGIVAGTLLLVHANTVNESRIARLAGILIIVGLAAAAGAALGW